MDRVQERVLTDYLGEQPAGTSFIIETGHAKHPFLARTPTMRVPMRITRTDNVYRAMWAMLLAVRQHNMISKRTTIRTVACPGLGTATGQLRAGEAAPARISWPYAATRHAAVGLGGDPEI
jgi:O-acetyl-ADP-ribose deacetylase (regulator of RNase III)